MAEIDRNKISDATAVVERLLKSDTEKQIALSFLVEAIIMASKINNDNWNVSLHLNGREIRFNVGQVYCIYIYEDSIMVLALRDYLSDNLDKSLNIIFRGYKNGKIVESKKLSEVPQCLTKVPGSVACIIPHDNLGKALNILRKPNRKFLEYAIANTKILPHIKKAHSPGFIKYLNKNGLSNIKQPGYYFNYESEEDNEIESVRGLTMQELERKAKQAEPSPKPKAHTTLTYPRNLYLSQFVKKQANGICHDCKKPAPFESKNTGEPFLETHHVVPLAEGGMDVIENVIALCPNCHRKRHHG